MTAHMSSKIWEIIRDCQGPPGSAQPFNAVALYQCADYFFFPLAGKHPAKYI